MASAFEQLLQRVADVIAAAGTPAGPRVVRHQADDEWSAEDCPMVFVRRGATRRLAAGLRSHQATDQRVAGSGHGAAAVGVVPVDARADRAGVSAERSEVHDAGGLGFDLGAVGGIALRHAEQRADEQALAGGDGVGGIEGDGLTRLDVVTHGWCPVRSEGMQPGRP